MMRACAAVTLLLLVGGCDGSGGGSKPAPTKIEIANPFHDQMLSLTPLNRALALKRAIQDSGQRCTRMLGSAYVGLYERMHMWTGRCQRPDSDWAVFIAANGNVQVRDCRETAQLGLPPCKEPELLPES